MPNAIKGIDVSKHQGRIDWEKVKNAGIKFAMLRSGYGKYSFQKDKTFEYNYSECKRLGIPVGTYWYSHAVNLSDAKKEAKTCLNAIKGKTFECGIWFDQEYEKQIKALSKQTRTDICNTFLHDIKEAGYSCGIYCSVDWIYNWLYSEQLSGYKKWIAQYSSECSYNKDDLLIWQYTSKGTVAGINGYVDMNYCYKDPNTDIVGSWKKDSKGWWYSFSDGSYLKDTWFKESERVYYFNKYGYAVKGFQIIEGREYYFSESYAFNNIKECQLIITNKDGVIL